MPFLPQLPRVNHTQIVTGTFLGYDRSMKAGEGNGSIGSGLPFFDTENLSGDHFPLLANRRRRSTKTALTSPGGLLGKAALAWVDGTALWYGGVDVTAYLTAKGVGLTAGEKQMVSMGAYLVIFPDKLYFNTENFTDCGSMENTFTRSGTITFSLCSETGESYGTPYVGSTAPAEKTDGTYWIDTSGTPHILKKYSEGQAMWVSIPTVYTKLSHVGIGSGFKVYDGVTLHGLTTDNGSVIEQIEALNGEKILYGVEENAIIVVGILDEVCTMESGNATVRRSVPDMDFVTQAQNRLWGCRYGLVNGQTVNEIYASALGDFKNWRQFLGVSTDSYAASVGTDGEWTGACTHLGYPLFFKEEHLHKVYVSSSGAHQIVDTACRGVQKGSGKSLAVVNETLFYKSPNGICAYDGALPVDVSAALGTETRYSEASAGAYDNKYYISMKHTSGGGLLWELFCFDTAKGLWFREDSTHAIGFAGCGNELYMLEADGTVTAVNGTDGTEEEALSWGAETGMLGYSTVEQKYVGRLNFRLSLPVGSRMSVWIEYDSSGRWESCGEVRGSGLSSFLLPIRPRRCDHFRLKLAGTGEVKIFSMSRVMEVGSDER